MHFFVACDISKCHLLPKTETFIHHKHIIYLFCHFEKIKYAFVRIFLQILPQLILYAAKQQGMQIFVLQTVRRAEQKSAEKREVIF